MIQVSDLYKPIVAGERLEPILKQRARREPSLKVAADILKTRTLGISVDRFDDFSQFDFGKLLWHFSCAYGRFERQYRT